MFAVVLASNLKPLHTIHALANISFFTNPALPPDHLHFISHGSPMFSPVPIPLEHLEECVLALNHPHDDEDVISEQCGLLSSPPQQEELWTHALDMKLISASQHHDFTPNAFARQQLVLPKRSPTWLAISWVPIFETLDETSGVGQGERGEALLIEALVHDEPEQPTTKLIMVQTKRNVFYFSRSKFVALTSCHGEAWKQVVWCVREALGGTSLSEAMIEGIVLGMGFVKNTKLYGSEELQMDWNLNEKYYGKGEFLSRAEGEL
jgi:hypothetical protein